MSVGAWFLVSVVGAWLTIGAYASLLRPPRLGHLDEVRVLAILLVLIGVGLLVCVAGLGGALHAWARP